MRYAPSAEPARDPSDVESQHEADVGPVEPHQPREREELVHVLGLRLLRDHSRASLAYLSSVVCPSHGLS